jgi:hypothetical protein
MWPFWLIKIRLNIKNIETIAVWETPWCPNTNGKLKNYRKKIIVKMHKKKNLHNQTTNNKGIKIRYEFKN